LEITFVSFSINFLKKQKHGHLCPREKVHLAKIDLHEMRWVYCSKPHIYVYIYKHTHTVKIIINSDVTLLFQKGTMILKYSLFRRDINYQRDYALKTILDAEGTLYRKRDHGLKNTFNFEGT
jgi:hypothetical protein